MNTRRIFITGTDTEIGKTWAAVTLVQTLVTKGYRVGVMKPVAAGAELSDAGLRNEDAVKLMEVANTTHAYEQVNPYVFEQPVSPHIASQLANTPIDFEKIESALREIEKDCDVVIIEGAGGWLAPISQAKTMADLALHLQAEILLVVGLKLGCLNHACLTAESILQRSALPIGWIANHISTSMPHDRENVDFLRSSLSMPCLGEVPYEGKLLPTDGFNRIFKPIQVETS